MVVDGPTIDELHTMGPYFYCLLPRRVTLTRQEIASQVEIAMVQTSAMGQPKRSRSQKTDRRLSEAAIPMIESTLVVEEPMQWLSLQATFPQCLKHLPYLGSLWIVASAKTQRMSRGMNHLVPMRKAVKRFDPMFRLTVSSLTLR